MPELLPDGWLEKRAADRRADAVAAAEYNLIRWAVRLVGLMELIGPPNPGIWETAYSELIYRAGCLRDLGWEE